MTYEKEKAFLLENLASKKIQVGKLDYYPNCKVFSYEILLPPDEDEPNHSWKCGYVRLTSVQSWMKNQFYHMKYKSVVNDKCFIIVCDEKKKPIEPEFKEQFASLFEDT